MTSKYGDMKYEIGKTYRIDGELVICENGFHYTDNVLMIHRWYDSESYDIFEVEPGGDVLWENEGHKYCSEEITLIRQLSEDEVHELEEIAYNTCRDLFIIGNLTEKLALIIYGQDKDLDILVNEHNYYIRRALAKHGRDKDLDIFVYDEDILVRLEVAKHGRDKDLDILSHDKNYKVRLEVVKHGRNKDLDILSHDKSCHVRREVENYRRYNTELYNKGYEI